MSSRPFVSHAVVMMATIVLAGLPAFAGTHIEKSFDLGPGGHFVLDSAIGSVTVTGGSEQEARVVFDASKELEKNYSFSFEQQGDTVKVIVKRKSGSWKFWSWGSTGKAHFEVQLPRQTQVDVDTSGGRIQVSHIEGEVRADTSGGSIALKDIHGSAFADTSGGSITAYRIFGPLNADTSGGGIHVEEVTGDLRADTSGGGIRVDEAGGYVDADTSGGSIKVRFAANNARGGRLDTSGGGISVFVDPQVGLEIDASTSGGSVHSKLELLVKGKISRSALHGRLNAGGELLKLSTSGGSIHIEAR